jgi:hypothetical protein
MNTFNEMEAGKHLRGDSPMSLPKEPRGLTVVAFACVEYLGFDAGRKAYIAIPSGALSFPQLAVWFVFHKRKYFYASGERMSTKIVST